MPNEAREQTTKDTFDADYEREQIRKIGEGMNRLAAHWAYLGDFRGGRSSREFWTAKHRLQRLCGVREAGDEPDFAESMQERSLQSLEKSVDATIKAMKEYENRHSTFFGFLARLFNLVSYARMQDTEIAIRRLQEMKNSIVRLRTNGEELNALPVDEADKEKQVADKEKAAEKTAEKTAEKAASKIAESPKPEVKDPAAKKAEAEKQPEELKEESPKEPEEELDEEPDVPAYDEEAEREFQNLPREERAWNKQENGIAEFFQQYDQFIQDHPDKENQINSNKPEDLKKLKEQLGKTVPGLETYLEQRIKRLKKIRKLEKNSEENFRQRQVKAPQIVKNADGNTTKVMLQDVTQPQMQHTISGCWSVTLSSMLRQKGVEVDQETIRAFRPDKKICQENNLSNVNADRYNSIDLSRELIMKVLPDTALNSVQTSVDNFNVGDKNHPWNPWNEQEKSEKREEFKNKMRVVLKRSLEADKGSLALLMKDHYQTVYGYEKVTVNGKEEEYVYLHDPNDPAKTKMTLNELADEGYKVEKYKDNIFGEQYSFDAQWLQDLTDDKGELSLDAALTGKGVTYQDHELKCDKLVSYANGACENANWRAVNNTMKEGVSITTFLPATVKNLAKNRIIDPIRPSELNHSERKLTGSEPRKHTVPKKQSDLSEVKKPEDLKIKPPVK